MSMTPLHPGETAGVWWHQSGSWPAILRTRSLIASLGQPAKTTAILIAMTLVSAPALMSRVEEWLTAREDLFLFWGQLFGLFPGLPGKFLRKCYYKLTLRSFDLTSEIGFLAHFTHRDAEVGARVYVGAGTTLGVVQIGDGALIGSRSSVMSGKHQHEFGPDGKLTPCCLGSLQRVRIGEESWVGEGSLIMADIGNHCIIAAGSVVSMPIPDGTLIGGNPARFVRRVWPPSPIDEAPLGP